VLQLWIAILGAILERPAQENSYCADPESFWNGASPTPMKREDCSVCTCADERMSFRREVEKELSGKETETLGDRLFQAVQKPDPGLPEASRAGAAAR
jgi:hypothetical protein